MTVRRILATSGGFVLTDRWGVSRAGAILLEGLRLTGRERPRVCLVLTAAGDDPAYLARSYAAVSALGCEVSHLALFPQPNVEVDEALGRADLVWVGGGSVANLLALWRLHGVGEAMVGAWERGTVLAGVSAGSICWHVGGSTDSFGPRLRAVTDGLALLPYGNGVHYDSEPQRRPFLHALVRDGVLPVSYATDDGVGILYEGTDPVAVLADRDAPAGTRPPAAYRVEAVGGQAVETRLPVGALT